MAYATELLDALPETDPVDEDLAAQVAKITARLDAIQHKPPTIDDDHGLGL